MRPPRPARGPRWPQSRAQAEIGTSTARSKCDRRPNGRARISEWFQAEQGRTSRPTRERRVRHTPSLHRVSTAMPVVPRDAPRHSELPGLLDCATARVASTTAWTRGGRTFRLCQPRVLLRPRRSPARTVPLALHVGVLPSKNPSSANTRARARAQAQALGRRRQAAQLDALLGCRGCARASALVADAPSAARGHHRRTAASGSVCLAALRWGIRAITVGISAFGIAA